MIYPTSYYRNKKEPPKMAALSGYTLKHIPYRFNASALFCL